MCASANQMQCVLVGRRTLILILYYSKPYVLTSAPVHAQVPMNSRPVCESTDQAQCLASSPATGVALTTPFVLSANAWASDSTLTFDFGVQHPDGTQCVPEPAGPSVPAHNVSPP